MPTKTGKRCENDLVPQETICVCPPGFTGPNCEIELNQCKLSVNPCKNGICVPNPIQISKYTCYCLPGYTGNLFLKLVKLKLNNIFSLGPDCSIMINFCLSKPCKFDGVCRQTVYGNYSCDCPIGTEGPNCEKDISECLSSPCKNGATCIEPAIGYYKCICPNGFQGDNCQVNIYKYHLKKEKKTFTKFL